MSHPPSPVGLIGVQLGKAKWCLVNWDDSVKDDVDHHHITCTAQPTRDRAVAMMLRRVSLSSPWQR